MSRSTRKPYVTDQNRGKPQRGLAKRVAARAVRDASDVPDGKAYRKFSCSWDIRDWSSHEPKNPKARRK